MGDNKYCIVRSCKNTVFNNINKNKIKEFFRVPADLNKRKMWLKAVGRTSSDYSLKTVLFVCEDHFNIKEDMENYLQFKMMGGRKRLKPNVVPHIFCEPVSSEKMEEADDATSSHQERKRQREADAEENRPPSPEIELKDEPLDIKDEPIPGTSGTNHLEPVDVNVEPSGINKNLAPFELQFDDNNSSKCNYETIIKSEPIDPSDSNHNQEELEISSTSIEHSTEHSVPPVNTLFEIIKVEPNDSEQFINENSDPLNYNKNKVTSNSNQNDLKTRRAKFASFGKKIAEQLELFPEDYALILQEKIENLIIEEKQKLMLI